MTSAPDRTLALVEKQLNEAIGDYTRAEEHVHLATEKRTRTKVKMEELQKEFDAIVSDIRCSAPIGATGWGDVRRGPSA